MPPCDVDPDAGGSPHGPATRSSGPTGAPAAPAPRCAFTVPAQPAAAWSARARLRAWLEAWSFPDDAVDDLVYVVSEAVSNAAEHAYPADGDGPIDVAAAVVASGDRRQVRIAVRDYGSWKPIDPDPSHRGHGLAAMAALAAEFTIRHHPSSGGTEVIMIGTPAYVAHSQPRRAGRATGQPERDR